MREVTVRQLRNEGGRVLDRVASGETVIITRSGKPVAELRPLPRRPRSAEALTRAWRNLPRVGAAKLRRDLDRILDAAP